MRTLLLGLAVVSVCFSQTYNISGIVTDTGTAPLSGAVVKLEKAGLTATSGADGRFTLSETVGIPGKSSGLVVQRPAVTLQGGLIRLDLQQQAVVRVQLYSVQGRLLTTVERSLGAGSQSMSVPQVGTGIYLYSVKIGSQEVFLKGNTIGNTKTFDVKRVTLDGKQTERQAKAAAAINDVIAATKAGYLNYRCVQYSSDTAGVAIKMIVCADTLKDIDGNVYQAVRIGNQIWTVENLRVTKYNDGSSITLDTSTVTWVADTAGKYCFYNNTTNADSIKKKGALYNWYAVNTGKLAPSGWHVPDTTEWNTLQNYLIANGYNWDGTTDSNKIAKSLAAKTDWAAYSTTGIIGCDLTKNNSSGFSALPGGCRDFDGSFIFIRTYGYWWSAPEDSASEAYYRYLCFVSVSLDWNYDGRSCGFSVRLVKD